MLKQLLYILSAVSILVGLTGCGKNNGNTAKTKTTIAVSIAPLANLVESICGDDYEVGRLPSRRHPVEVAVASLKSGEA